MFVDQYWKITDTKHGKNYYFRFIVNPSSHLLIVAFA